MKLTSKLPNVGTTIFTTMSQLAIDKNSINLGQGFPDYHPDRKLVDYVNKAMLDGHNQYPQMAGIPTLRQEISKKISNLYKHIYDVDTEITVTSGASEALMASILALVHPGDEVIIIEPFYDLYIPAIELAGGKPVIVAMDVKKDNNTCKYSIDWDKVSKAINNKTRAIILNFPHNPTGTNLTENDLNALEDIVNKTGVILISDEVYEHIVFNGDIHRSICSRPTLAKNSIVISSFGKTFHVTGWKIGYCTAPKYIMQEIRKVHQFNVFTVPSPMQVGIAQFMQDPSTYTQLSSFYQEKHDFLYKGLEQTKLKPIKSDGTFFLLADYSEISDMKETDFCFWLTEQAGVTVIPVSAFYEDSNSDYANNKLIRFCFAKQNDTLSQAIERLSKI